MSNKGNIRIKDIAKMAGVSVGTVDRVLHKRGRVSEEARKRIESVLKKTNYKPNLIARTLGSNRSLQIAVILPNASQDEYWALSQSGITQGIEEWAHYGVEITTFAFDLYDENSFKSIGMEALTQPFDGVLMAPIFYRESQDAFKILKKKEIPFLLFNTNIPEANPVSFIGQDLYQSGRVAGELLHLGQKKDTENIAVMHIYEDIDNSAHLKAKEKGLRDYYENSNNTIESHHLNTPDLLNLEKELISIVKRSSIDAIFVSTSQSTHIVASILESHNLGHIRLVGFDLLEKNVEYLKNGSINFLLNQNPKRMVKLGISHLTNHLLFHKELPQEDLFPLEVITKENVDSYIDSRIH